MYRTNQTGMPPEDPYTRFDNNSNEGLFTDYMRKPELQAVVSNWIGSQVYDRLVGSKENVVYPNS